MDSSRFDALIVRSLAGELSDTERVELEQWLAASPDHRQAFAAMQTIWNAVRPPALEPPSNVEHAWQALEEKLGLAEPASRMPSVRVNIPRPGRTRLASWGARALRVAAVLLLIFGGVLVYQQYHHRFPWERGLPTTGHQERWRHVVTANGERQMVTLPDGSRVQLNVASHLAYLAVADSVRRVQLEGEGLFTVVPAGRPFVVQTPYTVIRVLGTVFDVWARDDRTQVIVKAGRVTVHALATPHTPGVVVRANQACVHRAQQAVEPPRPVDAEVLVGWLKGVLVFDHTPLSELVAELQRAYDATILIPDPALGTRRVTGTFQEQSLDRVLSAICLTLDAQYRRQGTTYVISQK